ncbi:ROK family protein [Streptomyces sp. JJ38]|nr:ROK family protein [Streptomyces sp. JJ38]
MHPTPHVLALDVGGTRVKAALTGADGKVLHSVTRATGRERGPEAVVESIVSSAAALQALGEQRFGEPASAAGIAVPGIVDTDSGTAVYAANLGWRDVPLRSLLARRLDGIPVTLHHDVRAGGLAESRIGAARGVDRFLFVALGTGIAGAIGIAGHVEAGAHGSAGEIGHVVIRPGGPRCACGQLGCLEQFASAAAVGRAWAEACGAPGADAADCVAAMAAGDPKAQHVWQDAVAALADGLLTVLTLLDPHTLVIGGGLAAAGDALFAPLHAALARRVTFQQLPEIVPAALGDTASCLGAGLLAWDLLKTDDAVERHVRTVPPRAGRRFLL